MVNPKYIRTTWPDATALATAVAQLIVTESNKAVQKHGQFTLALSGGSTPLLLYKLLAAAPFVNNIPWKKMVIAFSDERFVPATSDDSNYKMAYDNLLSKVPVPKRNILRITTVKTTPEASAKMYEVALKQYISKAKPFDMVLLGIGEDGHTASVFPGSPLIADGKNMIKDAWHEASGMHRISFTLPFIARAKNVVVLVAGKNKAEVVKTLFAKKKSGLPAESIAASQNLFWYFDEGAASLI